MSFDVTTTTARVLIVDPHPAARRGLRMVVDGESGFAVAGEAADLPGALRLVADGAEVDVVALDARAARPDPAAAIAALPAPVVLLRVEAASAFVRAALDDGAAAYARKDDLCAVVDALHTALAA